MLLFANVNNEILDISWNLYIVLKRCTQKFRSTSVPAKFHNSKKEASEKGSKQARRGWREEVRKTDGLRTWCEMFLLTTDLWCMASFQLMGVWARREAM